MNSPFNEKRYKELLEGLEISEVSFSYVKRSCEVFRLDSFYYSKEFLYDEYQIDSIKRERLRDLSSSILSFGAYSLNNFVEYRDRGIPFIRGVNLKNGILDFNDIIFIDEDAHRLLWKSEVTPQTILLSMSGTIGDVAIAMPDYTYPMNSNQDIAKIRINDKVNTYYVYTFLLSRYGQNYLKREARGSVQQHVFLSQMEDFNIPLPSASFQKQVEKIVLSAHYNLSKSNTLFSELQDLIMGGLGLNNWQLRNGQVNVKSLKESFLSSGRLDAEHYQVKYDELEERIKTVPYKTIAEIQQFNARGVQPDYVEDGNVSVVNSKHILEDGLDYDNFERATEAFWSSYERAHIEYGDILIYTTGANIGRTQAYLKHNHALASNHVNILRVNGVNPIYLSLVLNSPIGRMQTEKFCTGSAQAEIYPNDIEKFIVPILDEATQETIALKVLECFAMKTDSKRLLNIAKEAVEIAISENEGKAMQFIKENENSKSFLNKIV